MGKKADWFRASNNPAPSGLRCYNCSKCAGHFSFGCTAARVVRSSGLVVAPVKLSPSPPLPVILEATMESGKGDGK
jgi:hypothetical protein